MRQLWKAGAAWLAEDCSSHAASIAFYTTLSLSPFLVLALAVASLFVESGAAVSQLQAQVAGLIGADGADLIGAMVTRASETEYRGVAALVAIGATVFAATAAIVELQGALDRLLGRDTARTSVSAIIRVRVMAVAMALAFGFLIVVSLILSAFSAALVTWLGASVGGSERLLLLGNELLSAVLVSVVFFGLLRILPSRRVGTGATLLGAVTAGLMFEVAKFALAWYIEDAAAIKAYGTAGSVVVLMLWVYYVAGIFLFGALVARGASRLGNGRPVLRPAHISPPVLK